ncbi:MAG: beta-methylgalactoside transporter, partial [Clostridia bacterium]|nr:beta-methylgalactoside transporter [Clostridia bacterium]
MSDKELNDGIFIKLTGPIRRKWQSFGKRAAEFKELDAEGKFKRITEMLLDNAMYIIIFTAIIVIAIMRPRFLSVASIINIISLTAAKLPIALGIGGAIVLTGTDISAGRIVGLTACIGASLLQMTGYANKMFPGLPTLPIPLVLGIVIAVGAIIGMVNGFFVAKFKLHPFIVTLSTQLAVFGLILLYLQIGNNNGQTLSGLDSAYLNFVSGPLFTVGGIAVPKYVL